MTDMNRRGWGLGAVLGIAALGGGAWLRSRQAPLSPVADAGAASGTAAPASAAASGAAAGLLAPFAASLVTTDGRKLGMADIAGRCLVLNFWAPWCPPCVHEMPELDRFAHSPAGKDTLVVGLAVDDVAAVKTFLAAHPVSFPIAVVGYEGLSWVRRLGNDAGALPFSALFDRSQHLVRRKIGPTTAAELSTWIGNI